MFHRAGMWGRLTRKRRQIFHFPFLNTSKMYTALQDGFPVNVRRQQPPAWLGDEPGAQTDLSVLLQALIISGEIRRTPPLEVLEAPQKAI